jgi:hypothetical protein
MNHPSTSRRPQSARIGGPSAGVQGSPRVREAHPLLGKFPLTVMTLATVVLLFALTMGQLKASTRPDPPARISAATVIRSGDDSPAAAPARLAQPGAGRTSRRS